MIPVSDKLTSSVINSIVQDVIQIQTDMVNYYDEGLSKFSPLLAYYDDRGKDNITFITCDQELRYLCHLNGSMQMC